MPLFLDLVMVSSSVIILTPYGQFWGCATLAFRERYVLKINSLFLHKSGKGVQTITKGRRTAFISHDHFRGFGCSGDAKNIPTEGAVLSVCVLLIYNPVVLLFLPSQSETTTACIVIGRAQCIWFKRREEAIISHWQYEGL